MTDHMKSKGRIADTNGRIKKDYVIWNRGVV